MSVVFKCASMRRLTPDEAKELEKQSMGETIRVLDVDGNWVFVSLHGTIAFIGDHIGRDVADDTPKLEVICNTVKGFAVTVSVERA